MRLISASRVISVGVLLGTLVGACTQPAYVPRTKPAEIDLRGIRSISVYRIDGSEGAVLTGMIEEAVKRSPRFELVERGNVNQILNEQKMSFDAAFQQGGVQGGKLLPASALIVGSAQEPHYVETVDQTVVRCGKKKAYSCVQTVRSGELSYGASIKVTSTETGSVVATRALTARRQDSAESTDGIPPSLNSAKMIESCRREIVDRFMHMIAPYEVEERVDLFEDGNLPELKLANAYLRNGEHPTAVGLYAQAVARADSNPHLKPRLRARARYALGVALALSGEYDRADEVFRQAIAILPDEDFIAMQSRAKAWHADDLAVAQQGSESSGQEVAQASRRNPE